jgi:hypothetical protein
MLSLALMRVCRRQLERAAGSAFDDAPEQKLQKLENCSSQIAAREHGGLWP